MNKNITIKRYGGSPLRGVQVGLDSLAPARLAAKPLRVVLPYAVLRNTILTQSSATEHIFKTVLKQDTLNQLG